jgi:putative DNA primase/helicase
MTFQEYPQPERPKLPSAIAEFAYLPPRPPRGAPPAAPLPKPAPPAATLLTTLGADVMFDPTHWIWPGRIARAKLTLIGGAPGVGKSTLAIDMAAAVTTGDAWPCDEGNAPHGTVMLVCPDGDIDTIGPRLVAAGVDLDRIHIISEVTEASGPRPFDVGKDLAALTKAACAIPDLQLIVFDALPLATGRNAGRDNQALLASLAALAKACNVAVVAMAALPATGHPGRRLAALPLGATRTAFLIETDPADEQRRLILQVKNEIAADPGTLAFRITDPDEIAARASFEPQHSGVSPAAFAARQNRSFNSAKAEAIEFLRGLFAKASQMPVRAIEDEARAAGLLKANQALSQCRPLRDARMALELAAAREGFGKDGAWVWVKPGAQPAAAPPVQDAKEARAEPVKPAPAQPAQGGEAPAEAVATAQASRPMLIMTLASELDDLGAANPTDPQPVFEPDPKEPALKT